MSTTVELALIDDQTLAEQERLNAAIEMMVQARANIASAGPEELAQLRAWTEAATLLANARKAHELALEASMTQVLCERRIGALLRSEKRDFPEDVVPANARRMCIKLSRIPDALFEGNLQRARIQSRSFTARWICQQAREESLKLVEPCIMQAWDGSCYVSSPDHSGGHWRKDLEEARDLLHEITGIRDWRTKSTARKKLDDLHAKARQLSQATMLTKDLFRNGDAKGFLAEAELHLMKAAEALAAAHTVAQVADWEEAA